ncbi:MAG: hypothetical protein HZC25_10060 [Rhodospirillales bacterium]|nr:hypothetical protein [Rhodospirillales bacterium]
MANRVPGLIELDRLVLTQQAHRLADNRIRSQAAPWTSFGGWFADRSSLAERAQPQALRIEVTLTVEAGQVELATIDSQDRIFDNTRIDATMGLVRAELYALDARTFDGVVLRQADDQPVVLCLHDLAVWDLEPAAVPADPDRLLAYYDLRRNPISYDFAMFLMAAERERAARGLEGIFVVFAPPDHNAIHYFPTGYDGVIDRQSRRWRFANVVLPMLEFLPTVRGHMVAASRHDALRLAASARHLYPGPIENTEVPTHVFYRRVNADPDFRPGQGVRLHAPPQGVRYAEQWLKERALGRKLVTITLRQYGYLAQRNSDEAAWLAFARSLDASDYFVVFLPDTDRALELGEAFPGFATLPEASFSLGLRMGLYEKAWLNLATAGGPMMALLLSQSCRFLIFRILVEGSFLSTVAHAEGNLGFKVGQQPAYLHPTQRLVWEADSVEALTREFAAMRERIVDERE